MNKIKAIVIDQVNGSVKGRGPYRNIKNVPRCINNFKRNMKQLFPNALHLNFYDNAGNFLFQEKYEQEKIIEEKPNTLKSKQFVPKQNYLNVLLSQWDP